MFTAMILSHFLISISNQAPTCAQNLEDLTPVSIFERQAKSLLTKEGLFAVERHMMELIEHEIFPTDGFDYQIDPASGLPLFFKSDPHYIPARHAEDLSEEVSELAYWLHPLRAFDFLFGGFEGRHGVPENLVRQAEDISQRVGDYFRKKWRLQ